MNDFDLELLMNEVVAEVANPALPEGLEGRLRARCFAMELTGDGLQFGTMDRLAAGGERRGMVVSAMLLHAAALALLFIQLRVQHLMVEPLLSRAEVTLTTPPLPLAVSLTRAGGGGGSLGTQRPARGNPPKTAEHAVAPAARALESARSEAPPAVVRDLSMAKNPLVLGFQNGALDSVSVGGGQGSGFGAGNGSGVGAGSGGNLGGGLRRIGGGVLAPVVLFAPEPEFSDEARKAKVSGNVLVYLEVDAHGRPMHVRVLRGIGMGLDERALEAVRQYRFKPAMEDGVAVPVEMQVEVNFHIF